MGHRCKNRFQAPETSQVGAKHVGAKRSRIQALAQSFGSKMLLSLTTSGILLGAIPPALGANRSSPEPMGERMQAQERLHGHDMPQHEAPHENRDLTITQLPEDLADLLSEDLAENLSEDLSESLGGLSELITPLLSDILPSDLIPTGIIPDQGFLQFIQQTTELLETVSDRQGQYALITASVLANDNPALTAWLSQIQTSPIGNMSINGLELGDFAEQLTTTVTDRDRAVDAIALQSSQTAAAERLEGKSPDFSSLPDLRQPGPLSVTMETITVTPQLDGAIAENLGIDVDAADIAGQVDLYVPLPLDSTAPTLDTATAGEQPHAEISSALVPSAAVPPAPVIIISHGVGGRRTHFAELAQHLASYGFFVVVPDHRPLGSTDASEAAAAPQPSPLMAQLTALGERIFGQLSPVEFIQRPLTISAILDELEQVNTTHPDLMGRLDVNNVGVIGHSLGGYTGLALVSGDINQKQLKRTCSDSDDLALNLSLTLQCQARELPKRIPDLGDSRVKAVMALNPVLSAVLGKKEIADIDVPVMIVTGSHDAIAPMMSEQLPAFSWLTTDHKYLATMVPGGHASVNLGTTTQTENLSQLVIGPATTLGAETTQALGVAFMQTYLMQTAPSSPYPQPPYPQPISPELYLTSSYGQFLSEDGPTLHLVTELEELN